MGTNGEVGGVKMESHSSLVTSSVAPCGQRDRRGLLAMLFVVVMAVGVRGEKRGRCVGGGGG